MLDKLLKLFFPPACGFCGKLHKEYVCKECETKLNAKLNSCTYDNKYFNKHIYLLEYKGDIRKYILKYKFSRKIIYV